MKGRILIVDDDADMRRLFKTTLTAEDFQVTEAEKGADLQEQFLRDAPDVVLLDVKLPDANGIDLLPQIKKNWPETEIIVLTGTPEDDEIISWAVEAIKRGAFNFLRKAGHFDAEKLLADVQCAIERKYQSEENTTLRRALETMSGVASPVFRSAVMQNIIRTVERIAPSDVSVLLTGESGAGKEVIADLLHALSPRNKEKIVKINCAALPRELIESELFGSVKGAFTGALADREGLFQQAGGGTLFLDEISEMAADTQSKLLRVLQDGEVRPVGGKAGYKTDCRIIAATNREPENAIKSGKLREDLFYRISAVTIHLPPLRERRDDILPLAGAFLKRFSAQANRSINGFTPVAVEQLRRFNWPGNVRQLQNEIQRAVLLCEGDTIGESDLSITGIMSASESSDQNFTLLEGVERNAILRVLKETAGNKLEAAKRLGLGRQTLYNKLKAYGIEA